MENFPYSNFGILDITRNQTKQQALIQAINEAITEESKSLERVKLTETEINKLKEYRNKYGNKPIPKTKPELLSIANRYWIHQQHMTKDLIQPHTTNESPRKFNNTSNLGRTLKRRITEINTNRKYTKP